MQDYFEFDKKEEERKNKTKYEQKIDAQMEAKKV